MDYIVMTKDEIMALREHTRNALQKAALNAAWAFVDKQEQLSQIPDDATLNAELAALEKAATDAMLAYKATLTQED